MKKLLIILPVLLLLNCRKNNAPSPFWGTASALMNGQSWAPPGWSVQIAAGRSLLNHPYRVPPCNPDVVDLTMHKKNPDGYLRESFLIGKIPPQAGTYPVQVNRACSLSTAVGAAYYLLGSDGDVLLDSYKVLESENNFLEVTSYDAPTGEMKGNFSISFVYDTDIYPTKAVPSIPDTVRFTNGQFHTKILTIDNK